MNITRRGVSRAKEGGEKSALRRELSYTVMFHIYPEGNHSPVPFTDGKQKPWAQRDSFAKVTQLSVAVDRI